jgi:hypothetical protein
MPTGGEVLKKPEGLATALHGDIGIVLAHMLEPLGIGIAKKGWAYAMGDWVQP